MPPRQNKAARDADPDAVLASIADYVVSYRIGSELARETAFYCLMDSLACAFEALQHPSCVRRLGPVVPGATMAGGARVPGTSYELDPVQAAFNIGTMIRWLDFNDTWLAAEWGHPSDNLGGILAAADYLSRKSVAEGKEAPTVGELIHAMIQAHEIQGVLALDNGFNRVGLDHVILVRVATAAVVTRLLGGDREQILNAVSNAWVDGGALRCYRHAPNVGPRKSWAAGDATSRGLRLALMALAGEPGCPTALTARTWGFYDVLFRSRPFGLPQEFGSYVMENILFKISYPAEFHAQTAVECAMALHAEAAPRVAEIDRVVIETQESALRIIDKTGPLRNPADRDHCMRYMVAVALLFGRLTAADYEDEVARDPRIDALREKMVVGENARFTSEYRDPDKRSIGNALQVFFRDGSATRRVEIDYPIGHRRRRAEGTPLLIDKFRHSVRAHFKAAQSEKIVALFADRARLEAMPVHEFMACLVKA